MRSFLWWNYNQLAYVVEIEWNKHAKTVTVLIFKGRLLPARDTANASTTNSNGQTPLNTDFSLKPIPKTISESIFSHFKGLKMLHRNQMKVHEMWWEVLAIHLVAQIIGVMQRLDQNLKCSMCLSLRHPKSVIHNGYYTFFEVMYYS